MSKKSLLGRYAGRACCSVALAASLACVAGSAFAAEEAADATAGTGANGIAAVQPAADGALASDDAAASSGDGSDDATGAGDSGALEPDAGGSDDLTPGADGEDPEGGNDGTDGSGSGSGDAAAAKTNGWATGADGVRHWYDDGVMAADKAFFDPGTNAWYWADADGSIACDKDVFIPVSNEDRTSGKWVRFDEQSRMVKGEDYRYGGWYFFDEVTGEMAKGFRFVEADGGKWVCYDRVTGQMYHGQASDSGHWYLFDEYTGATKYGFQYIADGNKWVFYDRITGIMLYGEQAIDGNWYYLDPYTGAVDYGWSYIPTSNKWVYFDTTTGVMLYGWHYIDGVWTYLDQYTGEVHFKSDVLHYAWDQIKNMYSATNYLITIDSPSCRVCVFQGSAGNWVPLYDWACSPGKASTPTVTGEYTIGSRGYSFGSGFTCYYWTQFYGDYLFHTIVYYQNTWTPMEGVMGVAASHGCVRLEDNNAYWIYTTIPSGTKVYSY